jgi:hypothetical protein
VNRVRPLCPLMEWLEGPCWRGTEGGPPEGPDGLSLDDVDTANELSQFITSRRAKVTPEEAGLPSYGRRQVPGLRREEVASLAGVSVEYYKRLERGNAAGASDGAHVRGPSGAAAAFHATWQRPPPRFARSGAPGYGTQVADAGRPRPSACSSPSVAPRAASAADYFQNASNRAPTSPPTGVRPPANTLLSGAFSDTSGWIRTIDLTIMSRVRAANGGAARSS